MGFFSFIKDVVSEPEPEMPSPTIEFVREYQNMKRFKGTKRINVSVYGDKEGANENCLELLDGADRLDCVGKNITLTGFKYDRGTGIKVAVDGVHIGVIWERGKDEVYDAIYSGNIEGVFIRIESTIVIGQEGAETRGRALLFALLQ